MEKLKIFLNPKASGGENPRLIERFSRKFFRSELVFVEPKSVEEVRRELVDSVAGGFDAVIAVGGDGTANLMLQELVNTSVALLLVPAGTANDLAVELGISTDFEESLLTLRKAHIRAMDVIKINDKYMATNGGLGIGAKVASQVNQLRGQFPQYKYLMKKMGSEIYSLTLALQLLAPRLKRLRVRIEVDNLECEIDTPLILVSNQPCLGGDFKSAPFTRNDDGTFNVAYFKHQQRHKFIAALLAIKQGRDLRSDPDFVSVECREANIKILSGEDSLFFGDGENLVTSDTFALKIVPQSFLVYANPRAVTKL